MTASRAARPTRQGRAVPWTWSAAAGSRTIWRGRSITPAAAPTGRSRDPPRFGRRVVLPAATGPALVVQGRGSYLTRAAGGPIADPVPLALSSKAGEPAADHKSAASSVSPALVAGLFFSQEASSLFAERVIARSRTGGMLPTTFDT